MSTEKLLKKRYLENTEHHSKVDSVDLTRLYLIGWNKMAQPINQGGLVLMHLKCCVAMLAKQVWRVMSNPNTLISQVIVAKYGKGNLEEITQKHSNQCWRWKDVQSVASIITDNLFWQIGTGEKVSLRSRYW